MESGNAEVTRQQIEEISGSNGVETRQEEFIPVLVDEEVGETEYSEDSDPVRLFDDDEEDVIQLIKEASESHSEVPRREDDEILDDVEVPIRVDPPSNMGR